ncbi:uncharacterized protein MELLADRAFT_116630 [Melampsora larici-populina 98AG31]|uniref:OTU domain-containing protein n=1 Tax=Melampsora larici-populina (strain 98AG31 / pathotype 3-4-7) TaxID=747676 RepID=F4RND4_MELLP|nr:uncharacterized protein MELLADRAFT_116630 [Melampsora larici-populina 98AG31]EGG06117.1 hypothetical protein MELLADRAFT_116630 [Melampsora larici-populina 98AG31]
MSTTTNINDILSRPKPTKKKSKSNKQHKPTIKKTNPISELSIDPEPTIEDDELLNQLLDKIELEQVQTTIELSASESKSNHPNSSHHGLTNKILDLKDEVEKVAHSIASTITEPAKRRNRHKDRLARRNANEEAIRDQARLEIDGLGPDGDERKKEIDAIESVCQTLGLKMVEMNPDGHCLFSAIADQLNLNGVPFQNSEAHTYSTCRTMAAEYMRRHPDDFIHYLPAADDGIDEGLMSKVQYNQHCDQVRDSAQWGGEPEILALSKCFKFPIHVIQASTPTLKIGDEEFAKFRSNKSLTISYHRKSYGLGEHYNSLRPR